MSIGNIAGKLKLNSPGVNTKIVRQAYLFDKKIMPPEVSSSLEKPENL